MQQNPTIYHITAPSTINACIQLPSSKSISNRALILKALSKSPFPLSNLSNCDDTGVMINAFEIEADNALANNFDIKAAGTAMRFLTAYCAQADGEFTINGTQRMKNRPIGILVDALRSLGAQIEYLEKEGFPPLKIKGTKLEGGSISLDGSISSQYISALMMIGPSLKKGLLIKLKGELISKPYIELTIKMMSDFGIQSQWEDREINIAPQAYKAIPYTIESDWSAASYWYEILALSKDANSSIELLGLQANSPQGDSKTAYLFDNHFGVHTQFTSRGVELSKKEIVEKTFSYDFVDQPDLAQTFAITACLKGIHFDFYGLQSLKIKETDRILALKNELKKIGFLIHDINNCQLEWKGDTCNISKEAIATYEDHRMAMAFAPACQILSEILIEDPEVVTKSYPNFWVDLRSAGFTVILNEFDINPA
ncbi:5-enolpyruvylshikimate-3-phosphate synthetase [Bacteroidales bacterium]|nr:5-enolpyruvylshikimate-3-phosphate synthetase [Bacteroidales bacterium]